MAFPKKNDSGSMTGVGGYAPSIEEREMDFGLADGGDEEEPITEESGSGSDGLLDLLRQVASGGLSPEDAEADVRKICGSAG